MFSLRVLIRIDFMQPYCCCSCWHIFYSKYIILKYNFKSSFIYRRQLYINRHRCVVYLHSPHQHTHLHSWLSDQEAWPRKFIPENEGYALCRISYHWRRLWLKGRGVCGVLFVFYIVLRFELFRLQFVVSFDFLIFRILVRSFKHHAFVFD